MVSYESTGFGYICGEQGCSAPAVETTRDLGYYCAEHILFAVEVELATLSGQIIQLKEYKSSLIADGYQLNKPRV